MRGFVTSLVRFGKILTDLGAKLGAQVYTPGQTTAGGQCGRQYTSK